MLADVRARFRDLFASKSFNAKCACVDENVYFRRWRHEAQILMEELLWSFHLLFLEGFLETERSRQTLFYWQFQSFILSSSQVTKGQIWFFFPSWAKNGPFVVIWWVKLFEKNRSISLSAKTFSKSNQSFLEKRNRESVHVPKFGIQNKFNMQSGENWIVFATLTPYSHPLHHFSQKVFFSS